MTTDRPGRYRSPYRVARDNLDDWPATALRGGDDVGCYKRSTVENIQMPRACPVEHHVGFE